MIQHSFTLGQVFIFKILNIERIVNQNSDIFIPYELKFEEFSFYKESNSNEFNILTSSSAEKISLALFKSNKYVLIPKDFFIEIKISKTTSFEMFNSKLKSVYLEGVEEDSEFDCLMNLSNYVFDDRIREDREKKPNTSTFSAESNLCHEKFMHKQWKEYIAVYNPIVKYDDKKSSFRISLSLHSFLEYRKSLFSEEQNIPTTPMINCLRKCQIRDIELISKSLKFQQYEIILINAIIVPEINDLNIVYWDCKRCNRATQWNKRNLCSKCGISLEQGNAFSRYSNSSINLYFRLKLQFLDNSGSFSGVISSYDTEKLLECFPFEYTTLSSELIKKKITNILFESYKCTIRITKSNYEITKIFK